MSESINCPICNKDGAIKEPFTDTYRITCPVWCETTDVQKQKIEKTAQGILDARELHPDCSLADLYDDLTMPPELRKAHQLNDIAVMEAYGFYTRDENNKRKWFTESETVARLMQMYQKLTK